MTEVRNSIIAGLVFGVSFGAYLAVKQGIDFALIGAPISGILFGAGIYFFISSKTVKRQTEIDAQGNEILYSGLANHFVGIEGVGGRLYLLHDKLQFKSHSFNVQNHELVIDAKDIKQVGTYNILGFVPTGLRVELQDGKVEKFTVQGRKRWKEEIEKVRG